MNGLLIDTNILIYLSKRELELSEVAAENSKLFISVITYMEALGFPFKRNSEEEIITKICSNLEIINPLNN